MAHNPSGVSIGKHNNNFVVSNDVLLLEVCKRCMDVVIVKNAIIMARVDHNVEEFDCRHCSSQDQYKMRSDNFSPYKLLRSYRCSGFCLPFFAHSLKNENKLSMETSCQLF